MAVCHVWREFMAQLVLISCLLLILPSAIAAEHARQLQLLRRTR